MVALCTPHHRLRLDVGLGIISRLRRREGEHSEHSESLEEGCEVPLERHEEEAKDESGGKDSDGGGVSVEREDVRLVDYLATSEGADHVEACFFTLLHEEYHKLLLDGLAAHDVAECAFLCGDGVEARLRCAIFDRQTFNGNTGVFKRTVNGLLHSGAHTVDLCVEPFESRIAGLGALLEIYALHYEVVVGSDGFGVTFAESQ